MTETSAPEQTRQAGLWSAMAETVARQNTQRFLWAPVCFGTGVGLYFMAASEPNRFALLALLLATCLAAWIVHKRHFISQLPSVLMIALFICVAGANAASLRAHSVAQPVLEFRYYGPVEGRVIAIDRSASQKPRYTLDQVRLNRMEPNQTPAKVRISAHGPMLVPINLGDTLITTGHLGPPPGPVEPGSFDFQRHVWFKQLGALGYTRVPVLRAQVAEDSDPSPWLRLQQLRYALSGAIKTRIGGVEGPFASAIVTGDRADLDPEALSHLRRANLAHLLAISGLHMGLLTGAVYAIMRLIVALVAPVNLRVDARKIAALCAFIAAFTYLGISGANIATQRAFIMVSVMLLAICLERPALSMRAVAFAALIVLAVTPEALFGPGFQMSFAATLALVAVFGGFRDNGLLMVLPSWANWAVSLVVSSFVAGAATAPYAAAHFNQIAQFGLLANLLSVPVMGAVVMPGALLAAIGAPLGLDFIGFEIMRLGLAWILAVAEFVSSLDGSTRAVISPGPWVLPILTLGGLVICVWQGQGRWVGVVLIAVSLGLWSTENRPEVLISESGRLVGQLGPDGRFLNKPTGEGFSAQVWLENDGDGAGQEEAAGRGGLSPNQFSLRIGSSRMSYDARAPDKLDLATLCRADFIVVPRLDTDLPANCRGMTALDFKREGAISLDAVKNGLVKQTSRAHQGTRLWGIAAQTNPQ